MLYDKWKSVLWAFIWHLRVQFIFTENGCSLHKDILQELFTILMHTSYFNYMSYDIYIWQMEVCTMSFYLTPKSAKRPFATSVKEKWEEILWNNPRKSIFILALLEFR